MYVGDAAANLGVMTGQIQLGLPSVTSVLKREAGKLTFAITTKSRSALVLISRPWTKPACAV
jgi:hypothetical protein